MPTRRAWLQGVAALLFIRDALAQGRLERGVYRMRGEVNVNSAPPRQGAELRAGDSVDTGPGGELVFVVGADAFLVRRNSNVLLLQQGLRIVTGAVMSVFASGARREIQTATATIGIRGTAAYVEA